MTAHSSDLPVLGAALMADELERLRNWVLADGRDLELQDYHVADVLDGDWLPLVERHKALLDGHRGRLGIHGPFWGFGIASHDAEIRKVVTRRLLQGLAVCDALGATQMVIHSPFTTWDYNNFGNVDGAREDAFERAHLTLKDVVGRAEAIGCVLVIENIEDKDPRDRVELARSFASPAVKVSLDTGHAHYAHVSTGGPPVDYYVLAAGDMLAHLHLQDSDGFADRHWLPGEGTIRWKAVFDAVRVANSGPRLIIEVRDKAGVVAGACHLRDLALAR